MMWTTCDVLSLFFPRLCLLCRQSLIEKEQHLCLHCHCNLPRTYYHRNRENPMLKRYAGIPQIRNTTAFLFFEQENVSQTLMHAIKYYGNKSLARQLGCMASIELKAEGVFDDIDMFVPVPLHRTKERKRGYNQSEWIARGFASVYQKPVNSSVLYRRTATATQTRKSFYERHVNVEKIFDIRDTATFAGQHVLLIDDVVTTGATSIACIEALTAIPDIRISVFSLAIIP
jgi:ComF family protein